MNLISVGKFPNLTFYGLSFSEPKRRRGTFFLNFHMWPQFNFQIFRCGLSLDETKRRIESMVIFYIYHRTNNYGHTNLGALMLKYDRIMRYKQRHIIIRATPHDQSKLWVTCVE